jgi:hypothetical protein
MSIDQILIEEKASKTLSFFIRLTKLLNQQTPTAGPSPRPQRKAQKSLDYRKVVKHIW